MLRKDVDHFHKLFYNFLAVLFVTFDDMLYVIANNLWYKHQKKKSIKRILVLRYDRLSDVIATLPALTLLKKKFPHAAIDIVVQSAVRELVEQHPGIDHVIIFNNDWYGDKKNSFISDRLAFFLIALKGEFLRLFSLLSKRRYSLVVDFTRRRRNILLSLILRIPQRWGFAIPAGSFLLTKRISYNSREHAAKNNMALIERTDKIPEIKLMIPERVRRTARTLAKKYKLNVKKGPVIVFHPGFGKQPKKRWPLEYMGELIKKLQKEYVQPAFVFVGVKGEEHLLSSALNSSFDEQEQAELKVINLIGKTTPLQLAALSIYFDAFIGNDSGPLHLLAAMHVPSVALYGATNVNEWRPLNPRCIVLKKTTKGSVFNIYDDASIRAITVDEVFSAVKKTLSRRKS